MASLEALVHITILNHYSEEDPSTIIENEDGEGLSSPPCDLPGNVPPLSTVGIHVIIIPLWASFHDPWEAGDHDIATSETAECNSVNSSIIVLATIVFMWMDISVILAEGV